MPPLSSLQIHAFSPVNIGTLSAATTMQCYTTFRVYLVACRWTQSLKMSRMRCLSTASVVHGFLLVNAFLAKIQLSAVTCAAQEQLPSALWVRCASCGASACRATSHLLSSRSASAFPFMCRPFAVLLMISSDTCLQHESINWSCGVANRSHRGLLHET